MTRAPLGIKVRQQRTPFNTLQKEVFIVSKMVPTKATSALIGEMADRKLRISLPSALMETHHMLRMVKRFHSINILILNGDI